MEADAAQKPAIALRFWLAAAVLTLSSCGTVPPPASADRLDTASTSTAVAALTTELGTGDQPVGPGLDKETLPTLDQSLRFERISVGQGLSEGTVPCIFQDSRGFLWFCTQDGLDRYDGQNFRVLRPVPEENSIAFNYVQSVCESPPGVLWIATMGGGLDRLDLATEQFTHYAYNSGEPGPSGNWLTSLLCDQDGVIFFGTTNSGLNRFDPATNQFTQYWHQDGNPATLSHNSVNAIYRDREGVLWVGTDAGLDRGDPVRQRFIHHQHDPRDPSSLGGGAVHSIYEDQEGVLWIGTDNGLDRFDRQAGRFLHYRHNPGDAEGPEGSLSDNSVRSIFEDREGVLWVGTEKGLNRLDRGQEQFVRYHYDPSDPSSLSNNWIWSIYEDREGVLWFGTYGGGLNKIDRFSERFAHFRPMPGDANSLSSNQIWSIYEDRGGHLWIGTAGAGLDHLDREQAQVTNYQHDPADPHSLSHNVVRAILEDRQGILWIGTDGGGLDRFDPQTGWFAHFPHDPEDPHSLGSDAVRVLFEDHQGGLWIGTDGGGLGYLDPKTEEFIRYVYDPNDPNSSRGRSVWSIAENPDGTLWVGTAGSGLYKLDRETGLFTHYEHDPSDILLCIHPDRAGQLWIATYGNGLYRFDPETETLRVYTVEDGLPSNSIYGILEDDTPLEGGTGHLWLSTQNGLSRFNPETQSFKNYSVSDGLQSQEFRTGAYHRSGSGEMFFGGVNGFNAFYPDRIGADNPFVPPVVLTSLTQGGQPLAVDRAPESVQRFEVQWPQNFFEFEFATLSYSRPEQNQHAHLLEGFDQDWVSVGNRRFGRYTNLPGGTYTLRIKGSTGQGVWNEEGISVGVRVVPPFWQTWTFRILVLSAVIATAIGIYRQRVRNVEERSRELQREVDERTREIERRQRVAEGLRDILAVLNSDRPVDEVLQYIVSQAAGLLDAEVAILHQIQDFEQPIIVQSAHGLPSELEGQATIPYRASRASEAILTGQPRVIHDLSEEPTPGPGGESDPAAEQWLAITRQRYRSFLAVPLAVEGVIDHTLAFYFSQPQAFPEEDLGLALALADQAALAIENARLYERAKELAAVEERQRLARDLHDAVSQTLFSASLISETLPSLWQIDREEAGFLLEKLQQLSRGALAEMRVLLLELRPTALVEASMGDLLRQLGQAVSGREGIPVNLTLDAPCHLPDEVQIAFYRIAQEALNNVVKHAEAGQVDISLHCAPQAVPTPTPSPPGGADPSPGTAGAVMVRLYIRDDGVGFNPHSISQDRLGLGIMRERAAAIGAVLDVASEVGQGTQLTLTWSGDPKSPADDGPVPLVRHPLPPRTLTKKGTIP